MKKKKFADKWKNQTELGKGFGLSAVAVGKILTEHNLKEGKHATKKALDEGYATFTPLKDGTPFYLWNVNEVTKLISTTHKPLNEVEYHVREVRAYLKRAKELWDSDNGGDQKIGAMMFDTAYNEVPKRIRGEVRKIVEESDPSGGWY